MFVPSFTYFYSLYFLHKAQWMFKHTLSRLLFYSSCANILQPLTVCRTIICIYSRQSYDNFFLTELVFKACSCAADNKASVSSFKFQFLSQCQDFSDFLSYISLLNWPSSFILLNWSIFSCSILLM